MCRMISAVLVCASSLALAGATARAFDTPVYFNMGGPERTDSLGRTWLGDQGAGLDPQNIRPDDNGGFNTIEGWCAPDPAALSALGFNPGNPADVDILRSIRWDSGGDAIDYVLEIPVDPGSYTVDLYFCESCCLNRHFKVNLQGATVFADVSNTLYAGGATHTPGLLSATEIEVAEDGNLNVTLLPCLPPECPDGGDANPILSALAVIPTGYDPCENPEFGRCAKDLSCSLGEGGAVTGGWSAPQCVTPAGYEVRKDGEVLTTLDPEVTEFTDTLTSRVAFYEVVTLFADGGESPSCPVLSCLVVDENGSFEIPLRINMAGSTLVDSRGRLWWGDGGGPGDTLSIRPDDAGGTNTISTPWCATASLVNDSLAALGLDPFDSSDQSIFNTLRWDTGDDDGDLLIGELNDTDGGDVDFLLELPVPNGSYLVNFYITDCCCPQRHFQIELQGTVVDDDVNIADHSASGTVGRTGRRSFDNIEVSDDVLRIGMRPCPDCECPQCGPGIILDPNAMCDAIEVLPAGSENPICPRELLVTADVDGNVTGTWMAGSGIALTGYELYRNGELLDTLAAEATEFTDTPDCVRHTLYELVPLSEDPDFLCPDLRLSAGIVQVDCPLFETPVRVNMGGPGLTDSAGRFWIGDPGAGLDVLGIRPNDQGGANAAVDWGIVNLQPESLAPLGFDPENPIDRSLISTIRWDDAANGVDYGLEVPLPNGFYAVSLYFSENFWNPPEQRVFKLEVQGEVVDESFSTLDYSPDRPETGWAGRVTFEDVCVDDELLRIGLPPCDLATECPGAGDRNAILNLLEILSTAGELPNSPPTAVIDAAPGTEVTLLDGAAEVTLDGSASADNPPSCGAGQGGGQSPLTFQWSKLDGPDGDTIQTPDAAITVVSFTQEGTYRYQLLVDDGEPENNTGTAEVEITVLPKPGGLQKPGDCNQDGNLDISDGPCLFGFLFLGRPDALPCGDGEGNHPANVTLMDANGDGAVDISDGVHLLAFLFGSCTEPPCPPHVLGVNCVRIADCDTVDRGDCETP